ncbi:Lysozyme M1 [Caballeronia novacaledonica]|uniref:Lysozyme M1 n=1 Tax=Caballeronia novacaledonica TaxID=1544861 RepID=A0A2U3IFH6_9BURK|nr:GH25 family lysozyme [Caballeronia novacaledonica]SPB18967.1 Lysozyme M1 [Caballeronia novacaledonica]
MWKMVITVSAAIAGIGATTMSRGQGTPATNESSWKALTTEPSRGQLFSAWANGISKSTGIKQFAFPYSFKFPTNADNDVDGTPRKNSYFGIDISHHNGDKFPLNSLKAQSVAFVYTKATQGTDFADKTFPKRWRGLKSLPTDQRVPRGAYHFLSSNPAQSGASQADRFLEYVNLHGGFEEGDLRPALDLEWDKACKTCADRWQTNKRTPEQIISTTLDFVNRVKEKTGWTPLIYTNKSFLTDVHITKPADIQKLTQNQKIWIFDLAAKDSQLEIADPKKNLPYVLWQFSWGGKLTDGYAGGLDVDSFKGTDAQFKEIFLTRN